MERTILCPKFGNCFFPDFDSPIGTTRAEDSCIFAGRCVEELAKLPDNISPRLMALILKDIILDLRSEN